LVPDCLAQYGIRENFDLSEIPDDAMAQLNAIHTRYRFIVWSTQVSPVSSRKGVDTGIEIRSIGKAQRIGR
jgi:hypothetical protein